MSAVRFRPPAPPGALPGLLPALLNAAERLGAGPQRIADPSGPGPAFRPRTPAPRGRQRRRRPGTEGFGGGRVSASVLVPPRSRGGRATADRCAAARRRFVGRRAGRPPRPGAGGGRCRGDREGEVTAASVVFPGWSFPTAGGNRRRPAATGRGSWEIRRIRGRRPARNPDPPTAAARGTTGKVSAGSRGAGDRSRFRRVPGDAGDTRPPRGLLVVGDPPDRGPAAPTPRAGSGRRRGDREGEVAAVSVVCSPSAGASRRRRQWPAAAPAGLVGDSSARRRGGGGFGAGLPSRTPGAEAPGRGGVTGTGRTRRRRWCRWSVPVPSGSR